MSECSEYEVSYCSYSIPTHDYRSDVTRKRQKETGYDPYKPIPSTRDERAKRFFANGKYATGSYKKWIEDGNDHVKEYLKETPEDVKEVIHAK
jgi:hypothetical protein